MSLEWIEGLVLIGNYIYASYFAIGSDEQVLVYSVALFLSTLNTWRVIRRINEFKKDIFVIVRTCKLMLINSVVFFLYCILFGCVGFAIYHNQIMACDAPPVFEQLVLEVLLLCVIVELSSV